MVKKIRIEKWELYYGLVTMLMFGFWLGYILGGSSSWAASPETRDEDILNGASIIVCVVAIFPIVKACLHYYRKTELAEKNAEKLKNSK